MVTGVANIGACGYFRLQTRKRDGRVTKDTGWFPNIITRGGFARLNDTALNSLSVSTSSISSKGLVRCQVGAGNTAPTIADDVIESKVAEILGAVSDVSNTKVYDSGTPANSYVRRNLEYEFGEGVAQGNITEVTIGSAEDGGGSPYLINGYNLFNRALVLDELGNPTSITVLADEFLNVKYEFRIYPFVGGPTNQVFNATIEGVSTSTAIKIVPKNFNGYEITTSPFRYQATSSSLYNTRIQETNVLADDITATSQSGTLVSDAALYPIGSSYNATTMENTFTSVFTPSQGNALDPAPIGTMYFNNWLSFFSLAMSFDPKLAKDATKSLTVSFKLKWSNYSAP